MLLTGIVIGLWVGVPLGILLIAMLGPRQREGAGVLADTRAMQDLLARRYPWGPVAGDVPVNAADPAIGRRQAG